MGVASAMGKVMLVTPRSIAASIEDARNLDDEYGCRQHLRQHAPDRLIELYNTGVRSTAWTARRGAYLVALRDALLATGLDCAAFIDETGMRMDERVERRGDAIVPILAT
jgi:hypothetical protein